MKARLSPEGAGFVVEFIGDDAPVDRHFVSDIEFVMSFKGMLDLRADGIGDFSPTELEMLKGAIKID